MDNGSEMISEEGRDKKDMVQAEPPEVESISPPNLSFKDNLLNKDFPNSMLTEEVVVTDKDVVVVQEEVMPSIQFSSRIDDLLNQSMRLAVVVKQLVRSMGYRRLHDKIMNLWKRTVPLQLADLEGDSFIVKFQNAQDYQNALLGGPWLIFGHYLRVQPWQPSFSPLNLRIHKVFAWVRLPGLP